MQTCKTVIEKWTERVRHEVHEFFNVVHEVCEWLPWPLDDLCDLVTDVVEKVTEWFEDVVHTIARVVCTPIDLAVAIASEVIGLIGSLPVIGPIARWVVGGASFLVDEIGGLPEGLAGLVGWLPKKHLDLHVFVLRDREGHLVLESEIGQVLKETERIYWARARVEVATTVHMLESIAPAAAFDIDRDGGMFGEDLTAAGSYFQATAASRLGDSATGLLTRRPAPICAFVIRNVSGSSVGCSLGPLADWIVIEKEFMKPDPLDGHLPNTLAHEMGHACGLLHNDDKTNLLDPGERGRGDNLSPFQRMIVRSSTHVAF